jgi:glycosyltransferase involved in cell wall biosynthesis
MPIALIEAQMGGIPVIATDVGSSREIINHLETGIMSSKDISELVLAIQQVVGDEKLRQTMGESAITNARAQFGVSRMLQLHRDVYSGFVKKN